MTCNALRQAEVQTVSALSLASPINGWNIKTGHLLGQRLGEVGEREALLTLVAYAVKNAVGTGEVLVTRVARLGDEAPEAATWKSDLTEA